MLVPVSDRYKIKGAAHTVSVAVRIRGTCFLKVLFYLYYLHLLITLCTQFCRCPLSNRGDKLSSFTLREQVPYKFQTHYAMSRFIINIIIINTFSAFTTVLKMDLNFQLTFLLNLHLPATKTHTNGKKHVVFKCAHDPMKPLKY